MRFINEAGWDRVARIIVGIALIAIGLGVVDGGLGIFLAVFGLVPLITGLVGWCPLYSVFGIRTNRGPDRRHEPQVVGDRPGARTRSRR